MNLIIISGSLLMDGLSTTVCSNATLERCWSQLHPNCSDNLVAQLHKRMKEEIWQVDVLLFVSAIFAGVMVGIGAYGHRHRYHAFARHLYLGATTLVLPIISVLLSADSSTQTSFNITLDGHTFPHETLTAQCSTNDHHLYMVILCACLVPLSAINTSSIVAGDYREARDIAPPFELLVRGIWIFYLVVSNNVFDEWLPNNFFFYFQYAPFAIIYTKMAYKYYAFERAMRSLALGHNPRLIVGYMQQLREAPPADQDHHVPPPLVVMGEEGFRQVVDAEHPRGHLVFNNDRVNNGRLVTIDRVWRSDNMLLVSMPQLKGICLSFALFKLLRCRFARYKSADTYSMETLNTLRSVLLKDESTFVVIADELSFLRDYYYSSHPISYSACWLPVLSISISLFSICFCMMVGVAINKRYGDSDEYGYQITCSSWCTVGYLKTADSSEYKLGSLYVALVPVVLLCALVVLSEARDIASFICSNWTKVALTCRSMSHTSLQKKWYVGPLLRCRCNLLKHWNGRMSQCSILMLHPRRTPQLLRLGLFLRSLLRLPDQKMKSVEVPAAVKVSIINTLRSSCSNTNNGGLQLLIRQQVGGSLLWAACDRKGTSDTILIWHIATSILEVKHPCHQHDDLQQQQQHSPDSRRSVATHLSRYCTYLVAFCPELLPDDDAWSKGLYRVVKKDAERALGGLFGVGLGYQQLIDKLQTAESKHGVLKDAAKLVKELAELPGGEETAWELLAGFWSEMILYIAPSDNLDAHAEAIARGGELITLIWALLTHIGIIDRPDDTAAATTSSS